MGRTVRSHVLCAGVLGHATDLGVRVVQEILLQSGLDGVATFKADNATDYLSNALRHDAEGTVLVTNRPTIELGNAHAEAGVPAVVFLHDLVSWISLRTMAPKDNGLGLQPLAALRAMQVEAAPLLDLSLADNALIVRQRELLEDLPGVARRLAIHLGMEPTPHLASDILAGIGAAATARQGAIRNSVMQSDTLPGWAADFARSYEEMFGTNGDIRLSYGNQFLLTGPDVTEMRGGVFDLTGRGGVITFGPYARLPRGLWRGRYVFAIADNAVGLPLRFGIPLTQGGSTRQAASLRYVPTVAGEHAVDLLFTIDAPNATVEMVLYKEQAVFEGDLAVGEVSFEKVRAAAQGDSPLYDTLKVSSRERATEKAEARLPEDAELLRLEDRTPS